MFAPVLVEKFKNFIKFSAYGPTETGSDAYGLPGPPSNLMPGPKSGKTGLRARSQSPSSPSATAREEESSEDATAAKDAGSLATAQGSSSTPSLATAQGPSSGTGSPSRRETRSSSHRGEKEKEKVKLHLERNAKIILALFPTPELKKEFKEATGTDPDPKRLMCSLRFRDLWGVFDASEKPTTKQLLTLRKLAKEIQGKGKETKRSEPPKSKSTPISETNKKRKNRSFSSERGATPTRGCFSFKIPRLGASPAAPAPSGKDAPPTLVEEEEIQDVIDDESTEPGLEDFADDIRAALPTNPNVAGKGEKRKDFPFLLYVHTGEEERRTMSKETWTLFYEKLNVTFMNLVFGGKEVPTLEWSGFAKGVGLICLANKASLDQMKDIVATIRVAEFSFRGWAKGEKGKYIPLSVRLPSQLMTGVFTAGKVLQMAILQNKLPDKYVVRGCRKVSGGGSERLLRFGVEEELFEALRQMNGNIGVAAHRLEIFYQGSRMTTDTTI